MRSLNVGDPAPSLVCASASLRARCASGVPYVSDSEALRSRSGTLTPDVVDPYGLPEEAYEETATEIEDFISRLVELAWPENVADNPSRLPH